MFQAPAGAAPAMTPAPHAASHYHIAYANYQRRNVRMDAAFPAVIQLLRNAQVTIYGTADSAAETVTVFQGQTPYTVTTAAGKRRNQRRLDPIASGRGRFVASPSRQPGDGNLRTIYARHT